MRAVQLAICAVLLTPGLAAAQGSTGFPVGDVGQVLRQAEQPLVDWKAPPSPLKRLSKTAKAWIAEETERQVESPRAPVEVALDVDETLRRDIVRLSKRERIDPEAISTAIVLKIMLDAEAKAAKAGDPARTAVAEANRKQAVEWSDQTILYMAAM